MPQPSEVRLEAQPWPNWPIRLRTSSSHEEGGTRHWNVLTQRFIGEKGMVTALETVSVQWIEEGGRPAPFELISGSEKIWPADQVLLASGLTGPEPDTVVAQLGLAIDAHGSIGPGSNSMTSRKGVFAGGDARRGPSLIVCAITEGRELARHLDFFLMGRTNLPDKPCCDLPRV